MKKFFLFLALVFAVGFAACGNDDPSSTSSTSSTTSTSTTTTSTLPSPVTPGQFGDSYLRIDYIQASQRLVVWVNTTKFAQPTIPPFAYSGVETGFAESPLAVEAAFPDWGWIAFQPATLPFCGQTAWRDSRNVWAHIVASDFYDPKVRMIHWCFDVTTGVVAVKAP